MWSESGRRRIHERGAKHNMDAKRFFEEARRMCKKQAVCRGCPALGKDAICLLFGLHNPNAAKNIDKAIEAVEKWSQEHPRKTRLMDFLEKHPNAPMGEDGLPFLAPGSLGYCGDTPCYACKKAKDKPFAWCWEQEAEEDG